MINRYHSFILIFLFLTLASGCGVYSLTGASIPPEAESISIRFFPNRAQLVEPTLSTLFTEALRDKFVNQTNLTLIDRNGDLAFEGEIVDYSTRPMAIQGDQTAALNKLSITVNVRFVNKFEPDKDFEQKFTQFIEYSSEADLNANKTSFIETINDNLTTDIFNKAVINW